MKRPIYQIDAFTDVVFKGNPAAIVPLDDWLTDQTMQNIAMENNLAETAFLVKKPGGYHLRWFTPKYEVDLCGHATLATAHYLFTIAGFKHEQVHFNTRSGLLTVKRLPDGYTMDFPQDSIRPCAVLPEFERILPEGSILEVWMGKTDYLLYLAEENMVMAITDEFNAMKDWPVRGFIVTSMSSKYDFISRCFYPGAGIDEDPVTGSAHTSLTPFWKSKTGRSTFKACQASARGGEVYCEQVDDRVLLTGNAVTYLIGEIFI